MRLLIFGGWREKVKILQVSDTHQGIHVDGDDSQILIYILSVANHHLISNEEMTIICTYGPILCKVLGVLRFFHAPSHLCH